MVSPDFVSPDFRRGDRVKCTVTGSLVTFPVLQTDNAINSDSVTRIPRTSYIYSII